MNTFFLKNLAEHIVDGEGISKTQAQKIVKLLSSGDLRKLMQLVRLEEEKMTAHVVSADELSSKNKEVLKSLFKGKKIVATVDKKIGAGIKAQVYDMIYDLSIKSKVDHMARTLEEEL